MTTNIDDPHVFRAPVTFSGSGTITPPSNSRTNTINTAVSLVAADADGLVLISSSGASGTRTIARSTLPVGKPVTVLMTAYATNAYTCAVLGGTVTFAAANARAVLMWNGSALMHLALVGATFA